MIDYKTLHPAVQTVVDQALTTTSQQLAHSGTPRFRVLLDAACDLFEQFAVEDQVGACAFILGMLWATMEGESTEFENEHKMLLQMRDRRVILDAMAEAVYREALLSAAHPDCPAQKRMM